MIQKIPGTEFGYMFDDNVTDDEYKTIVDDLKKQGIMIRCLICNKTTSEFFRPAFSFIWTGNRGITICNSIPDNQFYFNYKC